MTSGEPSASAPPSAPTMSRSTPTRSFQSTSMSSMTAPTGHLPDGQLKAKVDLLNKVYAPVLLQFQITDVGRHQNEEWYHVGISTPEETSMKTELGQETDRSLNFYTADL